MNRIEQDFEIARLIATSISGELTPEETARLESWRTSSAAHEALFRQLTRPDNLPAHHQAQSADRTVQAWQQLCKQINRQHRMKQLHKALAYAALLMLPLLTIGILHWQAAPVSPPMSATSHRTSIPPGSSRAILTLDNGTQLHLTDTVNRGVTQIDRTHIRMDSATLNYQCTAPLNTATSYNQIETPRGSEYSLVLSDGTRVWLNAMSSLRYPTSFGDGKREVQLTGEAYFEVSRSNRPFIVHTGCMQVEVLGTTFNLSAYPHETTTATLVNGSVRVATPQGQTRILRPQQQAVLAPGQTNLQVRTVDTAFYTSWVKGKIYFKDQRLEDILQTLSRWYDVHITYTDERLKDLRFGCHVNRYEEIAPFIHLLEKTGKVKASCQNNTITLYLNN